MQEYHPFRQAFRPVFDSRVENAVSSDHCGPPEAASPNKIVGIVRRFGTLFAGQKRPDISPINRWVGSGLPVRCEIVGRISMVMQVHHTRCRQESDGPPANHWYATAPVEHRSFTFSKRPGRSCMVAVAEPWSVIGCEDHQSLFLKSQLTERAENAAHRPVDL